MTAILHLAIRFNRDNVQSDQNRKENDTQSPAGKVIGPVLQKKLQGNQIRRSRHCVVEPVVPSQSKSESIVHEASV
jgi:hypothetical protein